MKRLLSLLLISLLVCSARAAETVRPNILWLVCEDAGAGWFGCYGNKETKTPNIDALAKQGFRYTRVYSAAPVCAPCRSSLITGMNAVTLGTQAMRSRYDIPHAQVPYYPDLLRRAGYYAANHKKTDYNIGGRPDGQCWDSAGDAAWEQRKPGQPFFQVINFESSHESNAHGPVTSTRHSPADVTLAKYHPDDITIRQNYAKYYDALETMDGQVGAALQRLEKAGLAEETIVVFMSDHGGVMPRSKRFLYDSGTRTPFIVRIPEKWKSIWPATAPGSTVDRLVSFMDLPKTWLSLAGAEIPKTWPGSIFLGSAVEPAPAFAFSFRDRMDERFDMMRSARDGKFVYIKNYNPAIPWGQHLDYLWKMEATRAWEKAWQEKRTDATTGRFFEPKPSEELYDCEADPDNVVNLAAEPAHKATLEKLRTALREWQLRVRDTGLLPEAERTARAAAAHTTVYEMAQNPKLYDLPALLDAADLALAKSPENKPRLLSLLKSPDSGLRYWGAAGLVFLGPPDADSAAALQPLLDDPSSDVTAAAAWALLQSPAPEKARAAVTRLLKEHSPSALLVMNILDWTRTPAAPFAGALKPFLAATGPLAEYERRMSEFLLDIPTAEKPKKAKKQPRGQ